LQTVVYRNVCFLLSKCLAEKLFFLAAILGERERSLEFFRSNRARGFSFSRNGPGSFAALRMTIFLKEKCGDARKIKTRQRENARARFSERNATTF